jgi:hypothetical protein
MKTLRKLLAAALFLQLAFAGSGAFACAACYGQSDSPMAKGMDAGIFVLLGFIGFVLSGATTFFVFIARRSAAVTKSHQSSTPAV